jgi:hypothetical protein
MVCVGIKNDVVWRIIECDKADASVQREPSAGKAREKKRDRLD